LGKIPLDPKIVLSGDSGIPFVGGKNDSISSKAFDEIVKNVEKIVIGEKIKK
jgi:hypothetical protein